MNRTQESKAGGGDYEDPEVEVIEDVYHILEGPSPERGEYNEMFMKSK